MIQMENYAMQSIFFFNNYSIYFILFILRYLRALLPCDQPGLRTLVTQRPTYQVNSDELLEKNVEMSLARFLEA